MSERIGDVASRAGDTATVIATLDLVRKRDAGRGLLSYELATRALDAEMAFARGDMTLAARLGASARRGVYFSRSLTTLVMLEADARRANGENDAVASLYSQVISHSIVYGDLEVCALLRASLCASR